MITKDTSPLCFPDEEETNITIIRYEPGPMPQTVSNPVFRRAVNWFGFTSTLAIGTAAFAPDVLSIPFVWRPWIFLLSIFWIMAFVTGMFNL